MKIILLLFIYLFCFFLLLFREQGIVLNTRNVYLGENYTFDCIQLTLSVTQSERIYGQHYLNHPEGIVFTKLLFLHKTKTKIYNLKKKLKLKLQKFYYLQITSSK